MLRYANMTQAGILKKIRNHLDTPKKRCKQARLARIIGITQQQYSKYELGKAELPKVKAVLVHALEFMMRKRILRKFVREREARYDD